MSSVPVMLRPLAMTDAATTLALMRRAKGGLGLLPHEMNIEWMERVISGALTGGLAFGAWNGPRMVGIIKACRMPSVQFQHVLHDLTVAVAPEVQGRGIARQLLERLLADVEALEPTIERVELLGREGLTHAIRLYENVGFRIEGRFVGCFDWRAEC